MLIKFLIENLLHYNQNSSSLFIPTWNWAFDIAGEHSAAIESSQSSGVNSVSTATADAKILSLQILIPLFYIILT